MVPTSASQFNYVNAPGAQPAPAPGSTIGSGTWLSLTGTFTGNITGGTRYGPGLFLRIS